jgi:hypothetical protein
MLTGLVQQAARTGFPRYLAESLDALARAEAALGQILAAMFAGYEPIVERFDESFAYITWKTDVVAFATDTLVISDNLITKQTIIVSCGWRRRWRVRCDS